ncbi:MAG: hypothetical protein AAF599_16650 [Bacteroidota bacterium]
MQNLNFYFQEYAQLLATGANLEIIDRFYADEFKQYENMILAFTDKASVRKHEEKALKKVNDLKISIRNVAIEEELQMVWGEMTNEFEDKQKGKQKLVEAFFQQWDNEKIVEQRFYYKGLE